MLLSNKINKFIFLLLLISLIILTILNFNSCFKLPPYGYINGYSSLVHSKKFCIKDYRSQINFETNSQGARILKDFDKNNFVKVFGDSQVLGLDVHNKADHYLNKIFPNKNFIIYAAPNNGPYEVLNSLDLNTEDNENIVLTFNGSTDFFRLSDDWNMYQHVHLSLNTANYLASFPLFYDLYKLIIFYKNDYKSKIFNNKRMQNLFLGTNNDTFYLSTEKYLQRLNSYIQKKNLSFELFFTHPYWLYDESGDDLIINDNVHAKYKELIFKLSKKYPDFKFSEPQNQLKLTDLTSDKRHLRSYIYF